MSEKKKFTVYVGSVALCVGVAVLLHYVSFTNPYLQSVCHLLRPFIYIGLYLVWAVSFQKRIIQKEARRCLIMIAAMIVFWMLIRMCKFEIPYEMPTALRYAWYLYYIPMVLLPTVSLYLAFYIRQPENYKLPERRCLLFCPALVLIGIVLTNDLHQLVFTFPEGRLGEAASYEVGVYGYGAMYYAIVAWDLGCLLAALLIILLRCRKIKNRKMLWMPFGAYGLSVVYGIAYYLNLPFWKIFSSDMTAALCLLFALIIESCIQCGLILVNNRYGELFQASRGINAQISDRNLNIRYTTGDGIELDKEEMKEALENPGYEKEGIRLNSIPINGGYAFWIEDIRQHRAAYESLYELREELRDRNQLLKLEYQKEKERKQAEEKNRLYDLMQKQTAEQFQQIAGYVDQLEQCTDHREYHRLLGKILIVGSYLKRRKNLTLSALEGKELKEEELIQSLRESCSNLVFCEIQGQYYIETGKETLPAQLVLRAYDFFEQIVELLLKQGGSFFYRLTELNGVLRISVNLEGDCQTESLQEKYPLLHMEQEEEKEWFLALQLSEKGGNDEIL